jgi:hypothetical protein
MEMSLAKAMDFVKLWDHLHWTNEMFNTSEYNLWMIEHRIQRLEA